MKKLLRQKGKLTFGAGFLTGAAATILLAAFFMLGWLSGERRDVRIQSSQDQETAAGAEVLTDPETLSKLDEVQSLIQKNYLNDVDSELMSTYLFKGIAVGLDDPYADYYSAEELESVMDSSRGSYTGIGAVLSQDAVTNVITVEEVYAGMPAALAGIMEGDVLLAINGEDITEYRLSDLVAKIKGMEDSFTIKIYRPSEGQEQEVSIKLGTVEVPAVSFEMKEDGIGYIKISEFTEAAVDQFTAAAKALKKQGMEQLIVDLRDNPGGLLSSVCDILDEVLPKELLVYTEDRNGNREEYYSDRRHTVDCETAVLVNGNSASASEIFAGAIQDYGIGPIVGTTTYGKGIVQKTFTLSDGSALKMTVEKYYTPHGQDIHGNGITPDIIVEEPEEKAKTAESEETEKAKTAESEETEEAETAESEETEEAETAASEETVTDPVLNTALQVLREHSWEPQTEFSEPSGGTEVSAAESTAEEDTADSEEVTEKPAA